MINLNPSKYNNLIINEPENRVLYNSYTGAVVKLNEDIYEKYKERGIAMGIINEAALTIAVNSCDTECTNDTFYPGWCSSG